MAIGRHADAADGVAGAARLRAGIIGGGFMGEVHSRSIRAARARVDAVASSSPERGREAAEAFGAERSLTVDELLVDPDIDVVHVCTPNASHADYAIRALEAGKHVVCEKPIATTVADAERMAEAARASGLVTAVPFVYRFHPMARETRDRIAVSGDGRILTVQGAYLQDWLLGQDDSNWRVSSEAGGASRAFADIGSHLVDFIEFVTGTRIVSLRAHTRTVFGERAGASVATEDLVAAVVEFDGGGVGTLLVSQVAPGRKNGLVVEVATPADSFRFEQENPELLWVGRRVGSMLVPRDPEQLGADAARLSIVPSGHPLGYQNAFDAFVADAYAAIGGDRRVGLPDFEDGLRAARITQAVLDSARSGADVTV